MRQGLVVPRCGVQSLNPRASPFSSRHPNLDVSLHEVEDKISNRNLDKLLAAGQNIVAHIALSSIGLQSYFKTLRSLKLRPLPP
jgi:hypothetical protein